MVFSSTLFLFLFLPLVLGAHFLAPRRLRNAVLLGASLFFYAWGEAFYVALMVASILCNYGLGILVHRTRARGGGRLAVALALVVNLGLLVAFKYANFLTDAFNTVAGLAGVPPVDLAPVHLPIGISFFTFQALSYVIDVYRGDARVQRRLSDLALYVALFPQLIAGPIVRYQHIEGQLRERRVTLEGFAHGVRRFAVGLGKKVLVANTVAVVADDVFALGAAGLTPGVAWLGTLCYTFQIYFDFSGYSDMAIGLGHMFGFRFPENFRHPYVSRSMREGWTRWHVSLSTWFRDYLYVPLGGNRVTPLVTYRNLLIVFFLCGLWHGASWSFVAWGLYHGLFLILERQPALQSLRRAPRVAQHAYTCLVWMFGWVFFRAETLTEALAFVGAMLGVAGGQAPVRTVASYWTPELALVLPIAALGSVPVIGWLRARHSRWATGPLGAWAATAGVAGLLVLSALSLSASTHNPFIYFRF